MKTRALAVFAVLAVLTAVGCDKKSADGAASTAAPAPVPAAAPAAAANPALLSPQTATEKAPAVFKAKFSTTKGDFVVEVHRDWAPNGADRFYNLVKLGFYDGCRFFRVLDGFMAQVGINGDPTIQAKWRDANIPDDPPAGHSNSRGMLTFATGGPNTRTTQFFINFKDNSFLDNQGFPAFGKLVEGEAVIDQLYRAYGEGAPGGPGPDQTQIQTRGNAYLSEQYPNLDAIKTARIVP